ncbi:hypothetical protein [Aneurinibacillus migulanus]|uniref:hypothetical protein n=1 Tax=Aneurinibacillus migulanus TaxID=47500 RepID=UPI000A8E62CB|nr:hypothetical protein [Aneurinibacillus migulanus]MCP1359204.1 hypothetical protein [Aneurinibacillus migulanus]MED0895631.1 hypothetical protein [Aneurinibacillus migulanus]MED1618648.1 hypothetical protein [Aneurinibacillus migulanus]
MNGKVFAMRPMWLRSTGSRPFIEAQLSVEWEFVIQTFMKHYQDLYRRSLPKTG